MPKLASLYYEDPSMDPWNLLSEQASAWGIALDAPRREALKAFYSLLIEGNRKANLTRITDEKDAVLKHFIDSLAVLTALEPGMRELPLRLIDVGAGAGFPGIPLLIANPAWTGTLLDSTRKKVDFMAEALAALGIHGEALHGRAEEVAREPGRREGYDLVLARAVAELNVLAEYCLPFARVGGTFVALKGGQSDAEIAQADRALRTLGGALRRVERLALPEGAGDRTLIVVEKVAPTPKAYPRRSGQPSAKPLC